jgi:hypothetical protein
MGVFLVFRLLDALNTRTDAVLYEALLQQEGLQTPTLVCYPEITEENRLAFYPTLYAVIPSVMTLAGEPCGVYLTP